MAGFTADYAERLCALVKTNLRNYREGKPLMNLINLGRAGS
jgi:hypothetical protein